MAAKSSEWRPGPTVCRCCLTEGCYKDISTEYFWMGKREVYSEMLKETLDVNIAYSKAGGPNSNSRLICEPCISRLRDATEFKRQVVECERMFMQHLDGGSTSVCVEVDAEPLEKIKIEGVKLEKSNSDDDFDDRHDFGIDDDDDDDDDLDNQPLTKLASKVPKKESVDLLDLLDNTKAAEKRKSTTKAKAPPPKKAKAKVEPPKAKPTSSKPKPEKKKKERLAVFYARKNARIIVEHITAYIFKLPDSSMACAYCEHSYEEPLLFRQHMINDHDLSDLPAAFSRLRKNEFIKVDCTDLKCRLCMANLDTLDNAADHLLAVHKKPLNLKYGLGLLPFVFTSDELFCALCPKKFPTLRAISRHLSSHYKKWMCEHCGRSFSTTKSLKYHVSVTYCVSEQTICEKCKTPFDSAEAKKEHIRESPQCWKYSCSVCRERFVTVTLRNSHLKKYHNIHNKSYVCPECKEVFPDRPRFYRHFKVEHTDQYACQCGRKFTSKYHLERHQLVHSKVSKKRKVPKK